MQHKQVLIDVGLSVPLSRPRWNLEKAKLDKFIQDLNKCVHFIAPELKSYSYFVSAVISIRKKLVSRCYRKDYIPSWNEHCQNLYNDDSEITEDL